MAVKELMMKLTEAYTRYYGDRVGMSGNWLEQVVSAAIYDVKKTIEKMSEDDKVEYLRLMVIGVEEMAKI